MMKGWNEAEHRRDKDGKFASMGGSSPKTYPQNTPHGELIREERRKLEGATNPTRQEWALFYKKRAEIMRGWMILKKAESVLAEDELSFLDCRYRYGMTWDETVEKMHYTNTTIAKIRLSLLKKLKICEKK